MYLKGTRTEIDEVKLHALNKIINTLSDVSKENSLWILDQIPKYICYRCAEKIDDCLCPCKE